MTTSSLLTHSPTHTNILYFVSYIIDVCGTVAWSPNGVNLVMGAGDNNCYIWDVTTKILSATMKSNNILNLFVFLILIYRIYSNYNCDLHLHLHLLVSSVLTYFFLAMYHLWTIYYDYFDDFDDWPQGTPPLWILFIGLPMGQWSHLGLLIRYWSVILCQHNYNTTINTSINSLVQLFPKTFLHSSSYKIQRFMHFFFIELYLSPDNSWFASGMPLKGLCWSSWKGTRHLY